MTALTPRRVLHVVRPAAGGIRQHVLSLLERTDPARFTLSVAAPAEFLRRLPTGDGLTTYPLEIVPKLSPFSDVRAGARLSLLVRRRADIVHAHGLRAAWVAALAHGLHPFPLVVTAHNLVDSAGRLARLGLGVIGRAATRVIAVSEAVADGLAGQGVPREKIVVIPNGIDIARFHDLPLCTPARQELGLAAETFVVGCIARLSPEKGVDVLLDAATRMPDTTFLIAGDGPQHETLAARLPANTRLLGRISDTRLLLAAVDALAVPSRQEGQGLVALEAMAACVPLVASRVGGLAEMLTEGENALLFPSEDAAALAAALTRLRNDASLREHLVTHAQALVQERYDVRDMARAVERVYEGV